MNVTFVFLSNPPIALLVLQGEFDVGSRSRLAARLSELDELEVEVLYLDAGHVTFVDCSCLCELERARRRLQGAGRRLELVAASPLFLKVARLAQYSELLAAPVPATKTDRWQSWSGDARCRLRSTVATWQSALRTRPKRRQPE